MNEPLSTNAMTLAALAIDTQIQALQLSKDALGASYEAAVTLLASAPKTVTSGLGKSSFIARKMAATMASVRLPALYLHPVDALHGDSGIMESGDVLVAFSKSGETPEVLRLVSLARDLGLSIVAVTARLGSTLAIAADAAVGALIDVELDPDGILPTASTTSALVIADLLAIGALSANGGAKDRLRTSHPEGAIGSSLMRTIDEVMHTGDDVPRVQPTATMMDALLELSGKGLGIVCVCDESDNLLGVLTDGDVRRLASAGADLSNLLVQEAMTKEPTVVTADHTLRDALDLMENRVRQIAVLPVLHATRCIGVLRLHDIVRLQLPR